MTKSDGSRDRKGVPASPAFAAVVAAAARPFSQRSAPPAPPRRPCRVTLARPASRAPTCHTAFPELTPYGRRFKIRRLPAAGGGDWKGPPIAAMYMPSFTHHAVRTRTRRPPPGLHTNDNLVSQQVSGFIMPASFTRNLGSFIQITGGQPHRCRKSRFVDALRRRALRRYAFTLFGKEHHLGHRRQQYADYRRSPGTPRHPSVGLEDFLDHRPSIRSAADPHRADWARSVFGGAGAYVFWNDMLYAAFTAYKRTSGPRAAGLQLCRQLDDRRRAVKRRTLLEGRDREPALQGDLSLGGRNIRHVLTGSAPGRIYGFAGRTIFLDVEASTRKSQYAAATNTA